jgi:hypothetical protein
MGAERVLVLRSPQESRYISVQKRCRSTVSWEGQGRPHIHSTFRLHGSKCASRAECYITSPAYDSCAAHWPKPV